MDSAAETSTSPLNPHGLTQRELEIAAALWLSAKDGEPPIDWDKFIANHPTYKDKKSAQATIRPTRNKLIAIINSTADGNAAAATAVAPAPKKRAAPAKRKKAAVEKEGDTTAEDHPTKKVQTKRGRKPKAVPASVNVAAEVEPEVANENQPADADLLGGDDPNGELLTGFLVPENSVSMAEPLDPRDGEI